MQTHGLMEKTLIRGRWKNSNVARLYICDGLAMLPRLSMTLRAKFQVARYSSMFINEHHSFHAGRHGRKRKHMAWKQNFFGWKDPAMDLQRLCHESS